MRLGFIVTITTIIICAATTNAEAAPSNDIGIHIEKSCQLSEKCVSYFDIRHLDTSPKTIGKLVTNGENTKRVYTPVQNNHEWLRFYNQSLVIVDPPPKIADRIKMITIKTQLDQFIKPAQHTVKEYNNTNYNATKDPKPTKSVRVFSHSYDVNSCYIAIISGKEWRTLLPDMIRHLQSNCSIPMEKSNITQDIKPLTKHNLSTSYKWKHDNWLKQIQECGKVKGGCSTIKQPTRGGL